jgi:hypothetical protein
LPIGIHHIVSLDSFEIRECPQLPFPYGRQWVLTNNHICELKIKRLNSLEFLSWGGGLPSTWKTRIFKSCRMLELPTQVDYSSLEDLTLCYCDSFKSFTLDLFPKLLRLQIKYCGSLKSLEQHKNDLRLSLRDICIDGCPNFAYFLNGGLCAPNLKVFRIKNCMSLQSLVDKMHILSIENLYLEDCPEVESFPEGGLPSNMNSISIINCEKLFASRMRCINTPFKHSANDHPQGCERAQSSVASSVCLGLSRREVRTIIIQDANVRSHRSLP